MVSGTLLAVPMLQLAPLVGPGSAVVAITVPAGEMPAGLRERSRVELVFPRTSSQSADAPTIAPVEGRVVGLPIAPDSLSGKLSLSVEVAAADSVSVAQAPVVRVVLLDPGVDSASDPDPASVAPANGAAPTDAVSSSVSEPVVDDVAPSTTAGGG